MTTHRKPLSAEAIAALSFFKETLSAGCPPERNDFRRSYDKPLLVWSDASWVDRHSDEPAARGGLGFVVFDPTPPLRLINRNQPGVSGYMPTQYLQPALPKTCKGRKVIHYVDNTSA
eukprot:4386534-Pleurochrysis_carterae.AAC.1